MSDEKIKRILFKLFYSDCEVFERQTVALKKIVEQLCNNVKQYAFLLGVDVETLLFNIIKLKKDGNINQYDLGTMPDNNLKLLLTEKSDEGFDFDNF